MSERLIAKDLSVTCHDGSRHENVTLKVCNGKRIYSDADGRKLCVEKINSGMFLVSAQLATVIHCNYPMEVD
jgi:hypothetical protein